MKRYKLVCCILTGFVFLSSCKNANRKTYAIGDFKDSLQTYLIEAVSKGVVYYNDPVRRFSTDDELLQLSKSEHPVLRALAFGEILKRNSFDHLDILLNHLDDTAFVMFYDGEFGTNRRRIADDLLMNVEFKTLADKEKAVNEVITRHNNLRLAYGILDHIPIQEKYYPYIRDMAQRRRDYDEEYDYEKDFNTIEYALYGLARFKKQSDIPIIRQKFCDNSWQLNDLSFKVMREFPNTAYLDVLEKVYYDGYLKSEQNKNQQNSANFFNALAVYKNERSAKILEPILDSLLSRKHFTTERNYINHELLYAIWSNPCGAYSGMRKKITPYILPEDKPVDEATRLKQAYSDSIQAASLFPESSVENHIRFF